MRDRALIIVAMFVAVVIGSVFHMPDWAICLTAIVAFFGLAFFIVSYGK